MKTGENGHSAQDGTAGNPMISVLFVCHGNICRSPMAEFVLKAKLRERGLEERVAVASAAAHDDEIGSPVYPPVRRLLAAHAIDCAGKTARLLTAADYDRYDLLIGMDRHNLADMHRLFGGDPEGRLRLLKDFAGEPGGDVADPWYTRDFEATWREVNAGCDGILARLRSGEAL